MTRAGLTGAASALIVGLLAGCTPSPPPLPSSRLLQSVSVAATTDGSVRTIDATTVGVGSDVSQTTTSTTSYDPGAVAGDLPVRVRTSYRTADSAGTNLADLRGYAGRVEISLAVENLTVHAEDVTFDVAGGATSRSALVGAPLTLAASTVLPGVSPSRVVTAAETGAVTNGVLSRDDAGDAVLQWASLLAPPTGGANATLTLVADVSDFAVPSFDLAVQPGLATDPTPAGALEAAFDTSPASALALQRRTIDVITSVDELLTRAGTTVAEVRTALDATSETLGVRTAEELRQSTASTASSMQGLSGQLTALRSELSTTVSGTESGLLQQLSQAIAAVDAMLGDTSATVPKPVLSGNGCAVAVENPGGSGAIHSELLRLTAELDAYGTAADSCREQVVASLRSAVGPVSPTAESCTTSSMTCSLAASGTAVDTVLVGLLRQGGELVDSLQPELMAGVESEYTTLSTRVDEATKATDTVSANTPDGSAATTLAGLTTTLDGIDGHVATLEKAMTSVGSTATAAREELGTPDAEGSLAAQNQELADELCRLVPTLPLPGATPGSTPGATTTPTATPAPAGTPTTSIDRLRAYLTDTPCSGTGRLATPKGYSAPMADRLDEQAKSWSTVETLAGKTGAGADLTALRTSLATLRTTVSETAAALGADDAHLTERITALRTASAALVTQRDSLGSRIDALSVQQEALAPAIQEAFAHADAAASSAVAAILDDQIRRVSARSVVDTEAVTTMFDRSVSGLHETAADIRADGTATVDAEHQALSTAEARIGSAISERTRDSLTRIATTIDASTRDTDAASALLAADLHKVLLDLGDRSVGGSGLLGSMTTSAAKVGTADVQLALASQSAQGYAGVRSEDVSGILLAQAQERASLAAADTLPAFHLNVPDGAHTQTVYSFRIGDER
ncbi:hypothetical protein [Rathayibacter iranicus]|uniref:Uncharacterized protein n=2 Tax=Rathayibacter iranicus TaxID=59737 RepID=A0AAD1EM56_9MICO|nr:hypothetical protein [Rathayibacter iranicus]AZZ55752.1 hypothetical protein C7V51_07590 [Rathayibacter iranicus]PPI47663.1 hypothetical protein C5E09_06625 [Rathayibacter iranicus]PPI60536.1 hypothetical protein C5E08_07555 [Rathayibacter iranicus]PPI73304.1 hypothetical protein C5E01_03095 [Rathayibacter iranicus]